MGSIQILSTPRMGTAEPAIFDPTNNPAQRGGTFSALRFVGMPQNGNVGGRYALPMEFDQTQFASAYVPEGQGVLSMLQEQPVLGTGYVSDGWRPWKYPEQGQPVLDDEGRQKMESRPNPQWTEKSSADVSRTIQVPLFEKHPMAGQTHIVAGSEKNEPNHVLMFRPIEVQKQVNEVYGLLSIDNMAAEARGETIAGKPRDDTGMLGEQQLRMARNVDSDILADRAQEENLGKSTVVHSSLPSNAHQRLTKPPQRVSR